jgi:hypothetical protein
LTLKYYAMNFVLITVKLTLLYRMFLMYEFYTKQILTSVDIQVAIFHAHIGLGIEPELVADSKVHGTHCPKYES